MNEEKLIRRTLALAKKGQSWTNPNPLVGAVLVKDGRIIAEGFHKKFGGPHAEVNAIAKAGKYAKGSTLFVNLEPCSHHGKTPPCTDAIIKYGIKKVVYASSDTSQNSTAVLKGAGIEVVPNILKNESDYLNRKFLHFIKNKLPYVTVKFAASLDGKMATKTFDSKWITNEKARKYGRSLRAENQAVLVGSNTALHDDPHLGARGINKKDPVRVILDTNLKTQPGLKVYRDSNAIIFTGKNASETKTKEFTDKGITVIKASSEEIDPRKILNHLAEQEIISVLVEGGGEVIGSFVDSGLVNEVYAFYAPTIIGGKSPSITGEGTRKVQEAMKINNPQIKKFDDNFLIYGLV